MILYFRKDLLTLDYIDIASELARFVFKSPPETVVHTISDRLCSSLDSLSRRGIPVDRLLVDRLLVDPLLVDPLLMRMREFTRLSNKLGKQRTFHLFSTSCIVNAARATGKLKISMEYVSRSKLIKIGKIYFCKSRLKIHLNLNANR